MEGCDMDFSDIRTIIIGEAGEYGKRLVRYLEIHLSSAVRVYHLTTSGDYHICKKSLVPPARLVKSTSSVLKISVSLPIIL